MDQNDIVTALKDTSTHYAEQPNPAQPYIDATKHFLEFANAFREGGLQKALDLPNNAIGEALQNPDNQAAMGITRLNIPRATLEAMRAQGATAEDMAARFGVHPNTIKNRVQEWGLEPKASKIDWDQFQQLQQEGHDLPTIADKMGLNKDNLSNAYYVRQYRARTPQGTTPGIAGVSRTQTPSTPKPNLPPMPDISAKEMADYLKTFGFKPTD